MSAGVVSLIDAGTQDAMWAVVAIVTEVATVTVDDIIVETVGAWRDVVDADVELVLLL